MPQHPRRFIDSVTSKLFGAALSLGSMEACEDPKAAMAEVETINDATEDIQENPEARKEGIEVLEETDIMQREWYEGLSGIDYALLRKHLPESLRTLPDKELTQALKKRVQGIVEEVHKEMTQMRFGNKKSEEKYFGRLKKENGGDNITAIVRGASALTGVPEDLLIAIGCTESQWNREAENMVTKVYGPMQMKLATARNIALLMNETYDLHILIQTEQDLKNLHNGVYLAAGYLEQLYEKYGKWDLAAAAYASGPAVLDDKIQAIFPIDFGEEAARQRAVHSKGIKEAKDRIDILKEKKNRTPAEDIQLRTARKAWTEHNEAYAIYHAKEIVAYKKIPTDIARYGVSVYTLSMSDVCAEDGETCGFSDDHSLEYVVSVDVVGKIAEAYAEK